MLRHDLLDGWTLRALAGPVPAPIAGRRVPAVVPGSTHTDLLAAGLIPDPYLDLNETSLRWMWDVDWCYELAFDAQAAGAGERVDLVLEGLDTLSTVRLDDRVVARTANQHRSYRVDVRTGLRSGTHHLAVDLHSALAHARAEQERLGTRPATNVHPYPMVRKMACSFGWDWGPDLQSAGIWKPVRLERWRTARLAQVRTLVTVDADGTGHVAVHVDVERAGLGPLDDVALETRARLGGDGGVRADARLEPGQTSAVLHLALPHAPLWWPHGHGEQPLLDLEVTLDAAAPRAGAGGALLDEWHRRIGFRTVELDTQPDEHGTSFTLRVNGRPLFVRGANWIPDDHLLTRITRDRLDQRLDQALGAHLNLLRVWGGGIYESEDFYELCDQKGLLVWQDFLLACAAYPEEQPLWDEIEAEAREHVARLTPHPSLVVWSGGNENLWMYVDQAWERELAGRTWGRRYVTELLPTVLAELDPTRVYTEGSPSSPGYALDEIHPNDPDHGSHHQWEVWNRVDYGAYRDEVPRFTAEFGFQGPPAWSTLERAVRSADGGPLTKEDPGFLLHQKAPDGNDKLDRGLAPHLGIPAAFADWHWATQLNQARAVSFAIAHYRSWWPRSAGAIVWQLNDCWPVTSWAAIDGDGRLKPLWYALRHAFADRLLTVQPRPGGDVLAIVNDSPDPWHGTVHLARQTLDGVVAAACEAEVRVEARSVTTLPLDDTVAAPEDPRREVLVAELDGVRTVHTWVEDIDLALDPAPLEVVCAAAPGGYTVEVRARSLVRDLTLLVDRLDPAATVDDALVTLPAGARVTFRVTTTRPLRPDELTDPRVLRSANDVVAARTDRTVGAGTDPSADRGSDLALP